VKLNMVQPKYIEQGKEVVKRLGITLEEQLGKGAFGAVYRGIKPDGSSVAVKFSEKTQFVKYLEREAELQHNLHHPNLVNLDYYSNESHVIIMVMEYCDCTLTEYLRNQEGNRLPEARFRGFARQMMGGLQALHKAGIAHRDLKPDNVLMKREVSGDVVLKLADFGFAKQDDLLVTQLGSPIYTAPEVGGGRYSAECDLWSIGVVMYEMLVGRRLFQVRTRAELDAELRGPTPFYNLPADMNFSSSCRSFIQGLLTKDPSRRLTFEQAFTHPFVLPKLTLYHLGTPSVMQMPVIPECIELGDIAAEAQKDPKGVFTFSWSRLFSVVEKRMGPDTKPGDLIAIRKAGLISGVEDELRVDTENQGFDDITAVIVSMAEKPKLAGGLVGNWDQVFPPQQQYQDLDEKLHRAAPNSVDSMNIRLSEIQLLLTSCNNATRLVNSFAAVQKHLIGLCKSILSHWRPATERMIQLQRPLSSRFNELLSSGLATQSFPSAVVIPSSAPPVQPIPTFAQQSETVSKLVLEGKELRDNTQRLCNCHQTVFHEEVRVALRILDRARNHLRECFPLLDSALSTLAAEWDYSVNQCGLLAHLYRYNRILERITALVADSPSKTRVQEAEALIPDLQKIALECPQIRWPGPSRGHGQTKSVGDRPPLPPKNGASLSGSGAHIQYASPEEEIAALKEEVSRLRHELDKVTSELKETKDELETLRASSSSHP